jgi:hypothetical protein
MNARGGSRAVEKGKHPVRKKILVLVLIAIAVTLLMAVPAFANTGTKSGGYWPYSSTYNVFYGVDGTSDVIASPSISPHSGYSSTTGKCKVCHAVHGAGSTDITGTTLNATEVLLRSTKAGACEFCHLTGGTFAMDPYYNTTFGTTSLGNYHGNGNGWVAGVTGTGSNWFTTAGGASGTQYTVAQSGHNAGHSHAGPGYQGCNSCHATHGANTMLDQNNANAATYILKNDPAKGVTANVGSGYADSGVAGGQGYGSIAAPVTTQEQFCSDCHDGTKVVKTSGTTAIVSQTDFDTYFPSCKSAGCHNSVSPTITANNTEFGVSANSGHNGRSHIMTTGYDTTYADAATAKAAGTNGITAAYNGCQTCHSVQIWDGVSMAQNTFPHWSPSNELVPSMSSLTAIDKVCLECHDNLGGNPLLGVGKSF